MRKPHHAQKSVTPASAGLAKFGTKPNHIPGIEECFSYFSPAIALREKIISSGPVVPTWSTDHVHNNKPSEGAAFLARLAIVGFLGGHGRRGVHCPRRGGRLSARSVVTRNVDRYHRRPTSSLAAAPLCRAAVRL